MRKVLVALGILAFSGSAQAAEGYGRFNWTGLYVGAHVGYAWGDWGVDLSHSSGAIHYNDPFAQPNQNLNGGDGALGGLQVGFNYQTGMVVVGLEADVSWTGMDADGRFVSVQNSQWDIDSHLNMFGTVRGRLGVTNGNLLVYATGGFAWGQVETSQATTFLAPPDTGGRTSGTNYHMGWTIGAGAEWMFAPNWTFRAEYLYVDLGSNDYALKGTTKPNGNVPYVETFSGDLDFHTVRLGLNYKFGN
jgi:outer membrane immunogenic protein